jgi:hypothetical protein
LAAYQDRRRDGPKISLGHLFHELELHLLIPDRTLPFGVLPLRLLHHAHASAVNRPALDPPAPNGLSR